MADDFTKAFKQVSKVVQKASIATVNKAAAVAKTQFSKDIREATDIQVKQLNTRLYVRRATYRDPKAVVAIGIRNGIDATYFKRTVATVSIAKQGGTVKRNGRTYQRSASTVAQNYQSVTVNVGSTSLPLYGAFIGLAKNSSRETVFIRLGKKRLKVDKIYLSVLKDAAIAAQPKAQEVMLTYYQAKLQPTLEYFLSKAGNITLDDDGDDGPA